MEHGDVGEAGLEAANGLRREGDFGHEDEGLLAFGQHVGDGAEVDLGLAAASDAVEEDDGEALLAALAEDGEGAGLLLRQRDLLRRLGLHVVHWVFRDHLRAIVHLARLAGGVDDADGAAGQLGELVGRELLAGAGGEGFEDGGPLAQPRGQAGDGGAQLGVVEHGFHNLDGARGGLVADAGGQGRLEGLAPGAGVVVGYPAGQLEHRRVHQRLGVHDALDGLDAGGVNGRGVEEADAVARERAVAEGDADAEAGAEAVAEVGRHGVVEGVGHGQVEGDLGEWEAHPRFQIPDSRLKTRTMSKMREVMSPVPRRGWRRGRRASRCPRRDRRSGPARLRARRRGWGRS